MKTSDYYRVNQPSVISDMIDGEVIIINMDSGTYFSLLSTGVEIWQLIQVGAAVDQIHTILASRYSAGPDEISSALADLLNKLESEHLIAPLEEKKGDADIQAVLNFPTTSEKQPFAQPVLEKYTDMAELLLLDPIHDVNETGWPKTKPIN